MPGSGWTVDSLKAYFDAVLAEKDKALSAALTSAKEAVEKSEDNSQRWREQANEWRGAMTDREKTFMSRAEFEAYRDNTDKLLAARKATQDVAQGKEKGLSLGWGVLLGAIGLVSTILNIYLATRSP